MKERPILMNGDMVRAVLAESKTQTRRLCKTMNAWVEQDCREVRNIAGFPHHFLKGAEQPIEKLRCPFGQPGDRLYVRETFLHIDDENDKFDGMGSQTYYRASEMQPEKSDAWIRERNLKWTPSIHMPRKFSRIDLEITGVRVERLHDITEADCRAEGCESIDCSDGELEPASTAFMLLWESINGPGSWDANPWLWVVEFKRI